MRRGGSRNEESVKDGNGRLVKGKEARKRWAGHFKSLLNIEDDREADVVAIGGLEVPVFGDENEREITKDEVVRALKETKGGKAAGMDGVRAEMFQMSGRTTSSKKRSPAITTIEWRITFVIPDGKSVSTVIQNTPRLSRTISRVSLVNLSL